MKFKYLSILIIAFPLAAGELKSPAAQRIAEQMSQIIEQKVQEITALEKAAGVEDVQINLSQSQQLNSGRFGTILSANSPGLVISVTPNSQASRLGIESGDQITSINGVSINNNIKSSLSVLQYAKDNTALEIGITRQGKPVTLTGVLTVKLTPGWTFNTQPIQQRNDSSENIITLGEVKPQAQECGQIKLGFRIEGGQKTRSLKTVVVVESVDGIKIEKPLEQNYLKLSIGYHKLKVYRKIHHVDKNRPEAAEYLIRVDANTTYYMAYRSDTLFSSSDTQKYAELPVIFKAKYQQCEL